MKNIKARFEAKLQQRAIRYALVGCYVRAQDVPIDAHLRSKQHVAMVLHPACKQHGQLGRCSTAVNMIV